MSAFNCIHQRRFLYWEEKKLGAPSFLCLGLLLQGFTGCYLPLKLDGGPENERWGAAFKGRLLQML